MVASNTRECFTTQIGKKVVGVLFDALPLNRDDLSRGTKTIVFHDGTGLTISSSGTFWTESAEEVKRAIDRKKAELDATKAELGEILATAGAI